MYNTSICSSHILTLFKDLFRQFVDELFFSFKVLWYVLFCVLSSLEMCKPYPKDNRYSVHMWLYVEQKKEEFTHGRYVQKCGGKNRVAVAELIISKRKKKLVV